MGLYAGFDLHSNNSYLGIIDETGTAHSAAGDLDTSFNSTGIVITVTGVSDTAYFGTLQADGKIVCVGNLFVAGDQTVLRVRAPSEL
jgi:hypothetical protein